MDLAQLAVYLHRDVREVSKLANRGYLPGKKVSGEWRFASLEINHWIETQMHAFTEEELEAIERRGSATCVATEPLISSMMLERTTAVPLLATTKASVLKELVNLAEQSWQIYDPDALLQAIKQREELAGVRQRHSASAPPAFTQGPGRGGHRVRTHPERHPVRGSGRRLD